VIKSENFAYSSKDFKWKFLSEILNVFSFRSCRQILEKRG
jgi:hypothetical protein